MMINALVLGAVLGLGLWVLAVGLASPRPALGAVLRAPTSASPSSAVAADYRWVTRLGRPFVPALQALGMPVARLRRDLAVLDRPVPTHLAQQATGALAGVLAPPAAALLLSLAGVSLGVAVPLIAALGLGMVGCWVPDLAVRAQAAWLRTDFRHGLSAYLDLVAITLAGGAGVESALSESAAIGHGWAFTEIRRVLGTARLTRTTPWATLRRLGDDLGIPELSELAASVSLADTEGARIRTSLAARADALRTRLLTDAETDAQAATERMSLPVTVLFLAFLVFIGYPALTQVLTGLSTA